MTIWLLLLSLALSVTWMLPIHYLPWTSFHSDAWIASVLFIALGLSFFRIRERQSWSHAAVCIAVLCLVPILQLLLGQIRLAGTAWVGSYYLIGLLLAILTGARWQQGRSDELANVVFAAIGIASTMSAGIALCQWLGTTRGCFCSDTWMLSSAASQRASANLSQPNQLATLLILGVLAYLWAWSKQIVGNKTVLMGICFLIFGLALTGSRMGLLASLFVLAGIYYWRHLWVDKRVFIAATLLFTFLIVLPTIQEAATHWLLLDYSSTLLSRTKNETRFDIWHMFGYAALEQPWFGYGWNQSAVAQLGMSNTQNIQLSEHGVVVSYAHNLFIDLVLWLGIPLGMLASIAIVVWVAGAVRDVQNKQDAILVMAVCAISIHAMLELPLYYAYFLLPLGLMIGMIDVRLKHRPAIITALRTVICMWVACGVFLVAIVKDYFVIEQAYSLLRLDTARIQNNAPNPVPDVWILTQLSDYIALARLVPAANMNQDTVRWAVKVTQIYPSESNLLKSAAVLGLNGQALLARDLLAKLCGLYSKEQCVAAQRQWNSEAGKYPALAEIKWPG